MVSMQSMTVAIIFHDTDYYNGGSRSMIDLLEGLNKFTDIRVIAVFPGEGSATEYTRNIGIKTIISRYYSFYLPYARDIKSILIGYVKCVIKYILSQYFVRMDLIRKLKAEKINLLYANSSVTYIGTWLKKLMDIPLIWHLRESGEANRKFRLFPSKNRFAKLVNHNADVVIVISNALKMSLSKYIHNDLMTVVHDDLSVKNILYESKNFNLKSLNILMSGRIEESKGQLTAIKALKMLLNQSVHVNLYFAGGNDKDYLNEIKQFINENHLEEYVHILGIVKDMNALRYTMHICIVATRFEAFGRATIEGMLSKMVVVGANSGATPELIQDGETGLLYEWGNPEDLSFKLKKLYNDRMEMYRLSENGFKDALKYTYGDSARIIMKEMKELALQKS